MKYNLHITFIDFEKAFDSIKGKIFMACPMAILNTRKHVKRYSRDV